MAFFDNIDAGRKAIERRERELAAEKLYYMFLEASAVIDERSKNVVPDYIVTNSVCAEAIKQLQLYEKEEKKYNPGYRSGNQ